MDSIEKRTFDLIAQVKALLNGHFVLNSGLHAGTYVEKSLILPHTKVTAALCHFIAEPFKEDRIEVVCGPEIGAVVLAHKVADYLTDMTGREVLGIWAEKQDVEFRIRKPFIGLVVGKRVLVVEDVLTTGDSVRNTITAIQSCGGQVVGVGTLWNRGQVVIKVPRFVSLSNVKIPSWKPEECPLCQNGMPLDNPKW